MLFQNRLFKGCLYTAMVMVFLLIFVGSLVRVTGAGMGCPDWPRCFGRWVPPTSAAQLPADYHEKYAAQGYAKTDFDPIKTWTEYANRLLGTTVGIVILMTFLSSLPMRRTRPKTILWAGISVVLVGFAGWLGAVVVKSNLTPVIVSAHLAIALLLIVSLILCHHHSYAAPRRISLPRSFETVLLFGLWITVIQILLGTQVRQSIDVLMAAQVCRCHWASLLGSFFLIHRSFSWAVLGSHFIIIWMLRHVAQIRPKLLTWATLLVCEVGLGIALVYFGFPVLAQPLHLLVACLIFAIQCRLILVVRAICAP